ncbi:unnamed protein product, partial [Iphiclides podalirius]
MQSSVNHGATGLWAYLVSMSDEQPHTYLWCVSLTSDKPLGETPWVPGLVPGLRHIRAEVGGPRGFGTGPYLAGPYLPGP